LILLQTGEKKFLYFYSYSSSNDRIFFANIKGDTEVVDDTGDAWIWEVESTTKSIDVIDVTVLKRYSQVDSISDLEDSEKTFYLSNDVLYIHFDDNKEFYNFSEVKTTLFTKGLTDNIDKTTDNYYNDYFYLPRATYKNIQRKINYFKNGIIPLSQFDFSFTNGDNKDILEADLGSAVLLLKDNLEVLNRGYITKKKQTLNSLNVSTEDYRFFNSAEVCPNFLEQTSVIDEKFIGKPKPIAYGTIRRGICVPLDSKDFDKDIGGTISFLAADTSFGSVTLSSVYDNNDNQLSFIDLGSNEFSVSIGAGFEGDIGKFKWSGVGYGGITNGLDIIKKVLSEQGDYAFSDSNYDTTSWNAATSLFDYEIGVSIQSSNTILSEIIEPISSSLFGYIDTLPDGRLKFIYSDESKPVSGSVGLSIRLNKPVEEETLDFVYAKIDLIYSNDFVKKEDSFLLKSNNNEVFVGREYQKKDLLTYVSLIQNATDANLLMGRLLAFTGVSQNIISFGTKMNAIDYQLLDLINIDNGTIFNSDIKKVEIIGKDTDFDKKQIKLTCREV